MRHSIVGLLCLFSIGCVIDVNENVSKNNKAIETFSIFAGGEFSSVTSATIKFNTLTVFTMMNPTNQHVANNINGLNKYGRHHFVWVPVAKTLFAYIDSSETDDHLPKQIVSIPFEKIPYDTLVVALKYN